MIKWRKKIEFFLMISIISLAMGIGAILWRLLVDHVGLLNLKIAAIGTSFGVLGIGAEILTHSRFMELGIYSTRILSGVALIIVLYTSVKIYLAGNLPLILIYSVPITIGFAMHLVFAGINRGMPYSSNIFLRQVQFIVHGIRHQILLLVWVSVILGFGLMLFR